MIPLALLFALYQPPVVAWVERGLPHVESRGDRWAVSSLGARGRWQVVPRWSRLPGWALVVPGVGEWEGRRILRRWQRRCGGDVVCALRCYACGRRGLTGACAGYAAAVRAAGGE